MTLRDAGREFARLTNGLAEPKEHVELTLCVLNNSLGTLDEVARNVLLSITDAKRALIPPLVLHRLEQLLEFFQDTAEAVRSGDSPAIPLTKRKQFVTVETGEDNEIVPLVRVDETKSI